MVHFGWENECSESLKISLTSFFLGACFMFAITLLCHSLWYTGSVEEYAAGVYILSSVVLFHMSEFLVAAFVARHDTHPAVFMLYNSMEYTIATSAAWVEFFVEWLLVPETWKISRNTYGGYFLRLSYGSVTFAGLMTTAFYFIRIIGMLHCGQSFSLLIEETRRKSHVLVEDGIYSVLRHPAYFGFFWKSLFSQLVLANPFCFIVFTCVLWRFFHKRILFEERLLESEKFFGERYKVYKAKTIVGIPFIF